MKKLFISLISIMLLIGFAGCDKTKKGAFEDSEVIKKLAEYSEFYDSENDFVVLFAHNDSLSWQSYKEYKPKAEYDVLGDIVSGKKIKDNDYEVVVHFAAQEGNEEHEALPARDVTIIITYDLNNPDELFLTADKGTEKEKKYHLYSEKGLSKEALIKMLEENGPYMEMDYEVLVTYDSKNMQMTGKSSVLYNEVVTTVIDILDVEYMGLNKYRFHVSNDGETGDSYFIIDRRHPEHYTSDPLYVPVINYEKYIPYTIEELFARLGSDGGLYFDKDRRLYARFKKDTKSVELWIDGTEYYESGTCSNLNFNDAASYKMDFLSDTNKGSYEIWIHLYGEQKMIFLVMPDKDHNIYSAMTVQN